MNIEEVIKKQIGKRLIIDTNLLILLIIGRYNINLISDHRKLRNYDNHDYNFVNFMARKSKVIYLTPGIISEVTNHLNPSDKHYSKYFNKLISILQAFKEEYQSKNVLLVLSSFEKLGYTDSAIIDLSIKEKCLVLTDDREMVLELRRTTADVLYFSEIKQEYRYSKLRLD